MVYGRKRNLAAYSTRNSRQWRQTGHPFGRLLFDFAIKAVVWYRNIPFYWLGFVVAFGLLFKFFLNSFLDFCQPFHTVFCL